MNRAGALVVALIAAPSIALLTVMPSRSEAPVRETASTTRAEAQSLTPQPPPTGNAGMNRTSELGAFRSSGLLSSTPIAADHGGLTASAQQSIPRPTARQPPHWISASDFAEAVMASPWPSRDWVTVAAIALCESGDAQAAEIDIATPGDHGLARGPMKVRVDAHPDVVAAYDLETLPGNLAGAYEVSQQALRTFGDRWQPWRACR